MSPASTDRTRVLVTHSDPLVRAGLIAALRACAAFEVFADDERLLEANATPIDVEITDYAQAMRGAVQPATSVFSAPGKPAVLIVTGNEREIDIRRAIEAGVLGYVLVGGPLAELVEAVRSVASGSRFLARSVAQRIAESLTRTSLTERELEVLTWLAAGESNKAIARHLRIQLATVKAHVSTVLAKLNVASRTQAAAMAASRGLIDSEPRLTDAAHAAFAGRPARRASQLELA